jgi:hypothetical protein
MSNSVARFAIISMVFAGISLMASSFSLGFSAGKKAGITELIEAEALECARESEGTDQAIVDCYLDRNLPYPEGV